MKNKIEFKKSKTYQNLLKAFNGESQARNKYTFFASKAKKEGLNEIASLFETTANQEKEHAEIWFKALFDDNQIQSTNKNLILAMQAEHEEWSDMYIEMSKVAKQEGFLELANKFKMVGDIEKLHWTKYNEALKKIKEKKYFNGNGIWYCTNCGAEIKSNNAPKICPVCSHPQAYFSKKK